MIQNLKRLLRAMTRPGTFYVLGAGASARLVPFTPGLRDGVKKAFSALGMYPADPARRTEWFERIVGGYRTGPNSDSQEVALQSITPGALDLLVQRGLSYPLHGPVPSQYAFLQRAPPSFFFNFNLDGLALAHLARQHHVEHPHGLVDREWTEGSELLELLELTLDQRIPYLRPKLLPGPEPKVVTTTAPYARARPWLRQAPASILLGYSFGRTSGRFDDAESFEYMVEHLHATTGFVFVVSPDPSELVGILEERLRATRVLPVALFWDAFTQAAMSVIPPHQMVCDWICEDQVALLEQAYFAGLEIAG